MNTIRVGWRNRLLRRGWLVSESHEYLFPRSRLRSLNRQLRSLDFEDFRKALDNSDFWSWWYLNCGEVSDKLFLLSFPSGVWQIPWELLVDGVKKTNTNKHASICLARTITGSRPHAPRDFTEPLRILILQGAEKGQKEKTIDLGLEASQVTEAWDSLEYGIKKYVDKPRTEKVTRTNLSNLLGLHKPHIIWFSGHGRAKPKSGLLFADTNWIDPIEFAELIRLSNHIPPYAVFWACDTARPASNATDYPNYPELYCELSRIGIVSLLATQSPVSDIGARTMACDLFRHLVAGYTLERAIARARANFMDDIPDNAHPKDWASAVVWMAGQPVDELKWVVPDHQLAQLQLLGLQALRARLTKPSQLTGAVTLEESKRGSTWPSRKLLWINGNPEDAELNYYWVRTLRAVQATTDKSVIAVDLGVGNPEHALKEWAEHLFHRLLPSQCPTDLIRTLDEIKRLPISGWEKLCKLGRTCLAISNPPNFPDTGWFWKPIMDVSSDQCRVVLSSQTTEAVIAAGWILDSIGERMEGESIKAAFEQAPRLAQALAQLNMPLGSTYLSLHPIGVGEISSFLDWKNGDLVFIKTSAGPIMAASARDFVLRTLDDQSEKESHLSCLEILGNPQLILTSELRERRLEHLLASDQIDDALDEAAILCLLYRGADRPSKILNLLQRISGFAVDIPQSARLSIAWAHLQMGNVGQADYWLNRCSPHDIFDEAWRHGLQAEVHKSTGGKDWRQHSLREIEAAIQILSSNEEASSSHKRNKSLRAYKQDRARIIQFLFHNSAEASQEYEKLLQEWSNDPEALVDIATVKRNFSECERSLSGGMGDEKWNRAVDLLMEAEQLVKGTPQLPILSEILYEKSKIAEGEADRVRMRHHLDECLAAAEESRHFMMYWIATNRLFWKFEEFSLERWQDIERQLGGFRFHGWAIRSLLDGRLKSASRLFTMNDFVHVKDQLDANYSDLQRNPYFDEGSDRFRIAATHAGLELLNEKIGDTTSRWQEFVASFSWSHEWLREQNLSNSSSVWERVN